MTRSDGQTSLRWRIGPSPDRYRVAGNHLSADGKPRIPAWHRLRDGEALWVEREGRWEKYRPERR